VKAHWPHLRAGFVLFQILAIATMALPGPVVGNEKAWNTRNAKADIDDWSRSLGSDPDAFRGTLKSVATGYVAVRGVLTAPFRSWASWTSTTQSWAMFASPQRSPAELHVDGDAGRGFDVSLYRPHDDAASLYAEFFDHNRMRKFRGRFGRRTIGRTYDQFASWLGKRVCLERPELSRVRVSLYLYKSPTPEEERRGVVHEGKYEHERVTDCGGLR
jgi:hypothetical protein